MITKKNILQIIPADGWMAIFSNGLEDGNISSKPLVCFVLIEGEYPNLILPVREVHGMVENCNHANGIDFVDCQKLIRYEYRQQIHSEIITKHSTDEKKTRIIAVIRAMIEMNLPDRRGEFVIVSRKEREYFLMKDIRLMANEISDIPIHAITVGKILKNFDFEIGNRQGVGFPVYIDDEKLASLAEEYGVS